MLSDKNVAAVLITAGWEEHIRIAVESMRAGKITAMEVGGAYDVEECWELVRTYEQTGTPVMMMENCCYDRFELLATAMAARENSGRSCTATALTATICATRSWAETSTAITD